MKKLKKLWLLINFTLIASFIIPSVASAAKLSKTKVELLEGETVKLKLKGTDSNIVWTSSDKSVAIVTKKGKVTAKSEGNTTITAKIAKKLYKCEVNVKATTSDNTITFTLPTETYNSDYFFNEFFKDIKISTEEKGKYTIIICNSKKVAALKKEMAIGYEEGIAELIANGAVDNIVIRNNYTEIDVYNVNDNLNPDNSWNLLFFYVLVPYYQFFDGVAYDDLDVYVRSYDANGNLIQEGPLKELTQL